MTEPERPKPGFATEPGAAGSTSDAATETAVTDRVGGDRDDMTGSAGHKRQDGAVPPDVSDTWNADRIDVGPGGLKGNKQGRSPGAGEPFDDVGDDEVQSDRTGYSKRSGM